MLRALQGSLPSQEATAPGNTPPCSAGRVHPTACPGPGWVGHPRALWPCGGGGFHVPTRDEEGKARGRLSHVHQPQHRGRDRSQHYPVSMGVTWAPAVPAGFQPHRI